MALSPMNRISGPDYIKAFAILLVVVGHTLRGLHSSGILPDGGTWAYVDKGIYLFHMPLFFFLSGLFVKDLLERTDVRSFIKRNIITLLLPLVIWSYLQMGLQYSVSSGVNNPVSLYELMLAPFPPKQQFWFLWALFVIACFSGLVMQLKDGKKILAVLAVLDVAVLSITDYSGHSLARFDSVNIPLIGQAIFYFPYYVAALFAASIPKPKGLAVMFALAAVLFGVIGAYLLQDQNPNLLYYPLSAICIYAVYNLGFFIAAYMERLLSKRKNEFLEKLHFAIILIGMNTMIIFLAHVIAEAGFRVVLIKLGLESAYIHIMGGVMAGLICPLLLVPVSLLLSKRMPYITGIVLPVKIPKTES